MKKLIYLFVVTSIFLSSCSKDCPIPEAQEEWLFVHTAESAKILNTTTIVMPLVDDIFAFTDRPYRKSYHMTGQHYADLWVHQGENCFQDDPPNAVLTWVDGGESKEIEVVITHAVLDSTTITYTIWDDSGIIIEDIVHPTLFVDGANQITYKIGDTGPHGGKVFYISQDGSSGLEAALTDAGTAEWGCYGITVGAGFINAIGTGQSNTNAINAKCGNSTAAYLADNYEWPNGQTGGFLPSKDELNELYRHKDVVGGFASNYYWSSTEHGASDAWSQDFGSGYQDDNYKYGTNGVRAVRAF